MFCKNYYPQYKKESKPSRKPTLFSTPICCLVKTTFGTSAGTSGDSNCARRSGVRTGRTAFRRCIVPRTRQAASDKNQLMDALLDLPVIPADYGATMVALYGDTSNDVIARDFAVQHIGLYAQTLNRSGAYDPDSDDARQCRTALLDAADETRTIIAAAAFRALSDVSAFDPHIDNRRLDAMLVSCVGDASASTAARVMAAQLCGERGVTSAMPALKGILADAAAPATLRRAAKWSLSRLTGDSP